MYSYHDVEAIKTNLEWIVNQATLNQASPRVPTKSPFDLLELIQSYEILLDLINEFGSAVIDAEIAEGLSVTENSSPKSKKYSRHVTNLGTAQIIRLSHDGGENTGRFFMYIRHVSFFGEI